MTLNIIWNIISILLKHFSRHFKGIYDGQPIISGCCTTDSCFQLNLNISWCSNEKWQIKKYTVYTQNYKEKKVFFYPKLWSSLNWEQVMFYPELQSINTSKKKWRPGEKQLNITMALDVTKSQLLIFLNQITLLKILSLHLYQFLHSNKLFFSQLTVPSLRSYKTSINISQCCMDASGGREAPWMLSKATYRIYVLPYTFNKPTATNSLCIRFN